jgi:hypothetical protein
LVTTVHETVGTLVVLAYLALTVVNIVRVTGRRITWGRQLSFAAGGLLLLQYILGFSLLGSDHSITPWHYLFALAAIVTVGIEHAMANERPMVAGNPRLAAAATAGTTILTVIAYAIGASN